MVEGLVSFGGGEESFGVVCWLEGLVSCAVLTEPRFHKFRISRDGLLDPVSVLLLSEAGGTLVLVEVSRSGASPVLFLVLSDAAC